MPTSPITHDVELGSLTFSGANSLNWRPLVPCRVTKVKAVITTAATLADSILTIAIQQADGTAVDPTGAAMATFTIPYLTTALNSVIYENLDEVIGDVVVYPGERLNITSDGGSNAGAGYFAITVEPLSFTDVSQRPAAHVGATDLPTALYGALKVTS